MKAERLFTIIGLVDEDLVEEAVQPSKGSWVKVLTTAAAACLALSLAAGPMAALLSPKGSTEAAAPAASAPAAGESAGCTTESAPFGSYGGPVLPLIGVKDTGITAARTLDFSISGAKASVTDTYTLTNPTDLDITFTAYYPVTGSLSEVDTILPALTVDGTTPETTLYAGRYAGTFVSAYGSEDETRTDNLFQPNTWAFYGTLLDGGDLEDALASIPALEEQVTVYAFGDYVTRADYDAATLAMEFTIDPEETSILTYGINGASWDEDTGWRQYDFFVPNGVRRETERKLLIVRGADIGNYTMAGYTNGGCQEPLEGLSCSVTRYETTLEALLMDLCQAYLDDYGAGYNVSGILKSDPEHISLDLFYRCVVEIMTEYGPLADTPTDRYGHRLDEIIYEALILDRIFYTGFEVTVPAGGSVTVTAACKKAGSFDYPGANDDRRGVYGYDLLTGSFPTTLTVTGEEITGGNVESGMELEEETHYFFEVTP